MEAFRRPLADESLTRVASDINWSQRLARGRSPRHGEIPFGHDSPWRGLSTYWTVLEMLNLGLVPRQRSIFHLWRNLAGELKAYGEANGKSAADELRGSIRAVWDAGSERAAVVGLMKLMDRYGKDPLASKSVWLVHTTFKEATLHLKGIVPGLARTSGVGPSPKG
ncbi:MAG: hypothetical protein M1531_01650 [Chloroflexi bacterium]|nr:hypothetical protein [Chloroflexota bacterium]